MRARALGADELARFRELIKRRRNGEPIAHIRGHREFFGLEIRVNPSVLIPRPETEILVEVALERTRERDLYGRAIRAVTHARVHTRKSDALLGPRKGRVVSAARSLHASLLTRDAAIAESGLVDTVWS